MTTQTLDVTILDREFRVSCAPEEKAQLLEAVAYLDKKMHEIKASGKVISAERIAIMAALNITNDLLSMRTGGGFDLAEFRRRMASMEASIDAVMQPQDNLF